MTDSDADISALARQVVDELDPGSTIGDKIVLSRRQLVAIAGGGLSAGALATLGVSEAEAQTAAGQVGTSTEPVDVQAATVTAQALEADKADTRSGYVDVTTSRSLDTTETNDNGSDLNVNVVVRADADNTIISIRIVVDGLIVDRSAESVGSGNYLSVGATVPNGSTYEVEAFADTANYSLSDWMEQQ